MTPALLALILQLVAEAPQIAQIVQNWKVANSGSLTADQAAAIDTALDAAHAALQAAQPAPGAPVAGE